MFRLRRPMVGVHSRDPARGYFSIRNGFEAMVF
jgi:hypothetical protein